MVVLPYGVGLGLLALVGPALSAADRIGLAAVATAPALLSATALGSAIGARIDRTGALLVGTIAAWWVLGLVRGVLGPAQNAMLPFIVGVGITSFIPMLPEIARTVIGRAGDVAFFVLVAVAIPAGGALDATTGGAAIVVVVAIDVTSAVAARIGGVGVRSAVAGAGTRDPAVAVGIAVGIGGSAAIPLYSGILLLALSAVLVIWNRRKAR